MADKYLYNNSGSLTEKEAIQSSAGAGDAGKIPALDSAGRFDTSMMPVGVSPETDDIETTDNLSAGDFVNIYSSTGVKCRKADASAAGKPAHGFVLSAFTIGQTAKIYRPSNLNNQLSGMTPGAVQYSSVTVPGSVQETVPSGSGQAIERLGVAKSATELIFDPKDPIILAS